MPEWLYVGLITALFTLLYLLLGLCVAIAASQLDERIEGERAESLEPPFGWGIFFVWPLVVIYYILRLVWFIFSKSGETFWRLLTNRI